MTEVFKGSFTRQEPIPEDAIEAAVAVMRSGRLHRYTIEEGEAGEAALLEQDFGARVGARYCLAVASGGYALAIALRALGVGPGQRVLSNAFTLAPVPGAIASVGADPVFVGMTEDLTIDLVDLEAKAGMATVLLLSHMRGHIADMDRLMEICNARGVRVVEDCAHTMGAKWRETWSGRHGLIGCYSCQSYKHVNAGEGGLVVTDDPDLAARMTLLSGSYMFHGRHTAGPPPDAFEALTGTTPNMSGRMDNLRAAILRPQIRRLSEQCAAWTERYCAVEDALRETPGMRLVRRDPRETFVGSSFQFLLPDWDEQAKRRVVSGCGARGVALKWFGAAHPDGYTSRYDHWEYAAPATMPETDRILAGVFDLRLPLTFSLEDCRRIGRIIRDEVSRAFQRG